MYCGLNDYARDRRQRPWYAKEFRPAKLDDGLESDCHSRNEHRVTLARSRLSKIKSLALANLLQHIAGLRVRTGDDQCAMGLRRLAVRHLQRGRSHQCETKFSTWSDNWYGSRRRNLPAGQPGLPGCLWRNRCRSVRSFSRNSSFDDDRACGSETDYDHDL